MYLDELAGTPLFRGLRKRDLVFAGRLWTSVDVEEAQVLTVQGAPGRQAFIIVSGNAEVRVDGKLVAVLGPGEVVGEMAVIDRRLRSATVTAATPMTVLVADPLGFASFIAHPRVARNILDVEISRLRKTNAPGDGSDVRV